MTPNLADKRINGRLSLAPSGFSSTERNEISLPTLHLAAHHPGLGGGAGPEVAIIVETGHYIFTTLRGMDIS